MSGVLRKENARTMPVRRKEIVGFALLGTLFFFFLACSISALVLAQDTGATVSIGAIEIPPQGVAKVPIMVKNVSALGGGVIHLTFDSSVVRVIKVSEGGGNSLTVGAWNCNTSVNPGYVNIAAYSTLLPGHTGEVIFAYLTCEAVGAEGNTTTLNLSVDSLFTIGYEDIPFEVVEGTVSIVGTNVSGLDTGSGAYPSIAGTHTGVIIPNRAITITKLYTYPCAATGGHTEYARLWNETGLDVAAYWTSFDGDWQTITFDQPFTLHAGETYHYEIRTSSYSQIIHKPEHTTEDGSFINCSSFTGLDGYVYEDWIPAIKLGNDEEDG